MKKIVVAIDSFKGSLTTFETGKAVKEAAEKVYPDVETVISPIADGGEGTVEAIISANNGEIIETNVCNPLGKVISANYGYIPKTKTAIIEMSAAAGITLIKDNECNPMNTTTYGVGEMILDAISKGCRRFIIGIGGSSTNDGGVGMLQALGFEFLDKSGNQVLFGAKGLKDIAIIKTENAAVELKECSFCVACDVKNVLCGNDGCSAIYGPQKGATPEMIKDMDLWLGNYARITKEVIPTSDAKFPGASLAKNLVRLDGHGAAEILKAILKLFPLDTYEKPVYLMEKVPGDEVETPIWDEYKEIVSKHTDEEISYIERYKFYERAKKAYAVVMSGEGALYANVLLKKGVVKS